MKKMLAKPFTINLPKGIALLAFAASVSAPLSGATIQLSSLNGSNGFIINGDASEDRLGRGLTGIGDINGDGLDDFAVSAYGAKGSANTGNQVGEVYVIFGRENFSDAVLDATTLLPGEGFIIYGEDNLDLTGLDVASAGDFNGDGYADLLIGVRGGDGPTDSISNLGEAVILFGKATFPATVNLSSIAQGNKNQGFLLYGRNAEDFTAQQVSGVGDLNGDGLSDVAIASMDGYYTATKGPGEVYVVFGTTNISGTQFQLSSLNGTNGFLVEGLSASDLLGFSVSGGGDVNGDGISDLILGSPGGSGSNDTFAFAGETHIIFGKTTGFSAEFELSTLDGTNGFSLFASSNYALSGRAVSSLGDINGDGFSEIGYNLGNVGSTAGGAVVLFGTNTGFSSEIQTQDIANGDGTLGYVLMGGDSGDRAGYSIQGAGDTNGDGLADILVGAQRADGPGNTGDRMGEAYLIQGNETIPGVQVGLDSLGAPNSPQGDLFVGIDDLDYAGSGLAAAGDINGDGVGDFIIGAPNSASMGNGRTQGGEAYILFGSIDAPEATSVAFIPAGEDAPKIGVGMIGDHSNFSTPFTRLWIDLAAPNNQPRRVQATLKYDADNQIENLEGVAPSLWEIHLDGDAIAATATFKYLSSDFAGYPEEDLRIYYRSSADGEWVLQESVQHDLNRNQVTVAYSGNGFYAIAPRPPLFPFRFDTSDLIQNESGLAGAGFFGTQFNHYAGSSVSGAGDFNGDGLSDFLVSIPGYDGVSSNYVNTGGAVFIIFGKENNFSGVNPLQEDVLDEATILYSGAENESLGEKPESVSSLGDVNGDGYDDIIVSTFKSSGFEGIGENAGEAYVVFGTANPPASKNVRDLNGSDGFIIGAIESFDYLGVSVSSAGDINGDGLNDILVSAPRADSYSNTMISAGETYIILGKSTPYPQLVDLRDNINVIDLLAHIFRGINPSDNSGTSVSSIGDLNADGFDDILVTAPYGDGVTDSVSNSGEAYVIFGSAGAPFNFPTVTGLNGTTGFAIHSGNEGDNLGVSASSAGDVNGDGIQDLLLGIPRGDGLSEASESAGEAVVVFGSTNAFSPILELPSGLPADGTKGIILFDGLTLQYSGTKVSAAGDINGDGFGDVMVCSRLSDYSKGINSLSFGKAIVIFGKSSFGKRDVELQEINSGEGFFFRGDQQNQNLGVSASSIGDTNGDGISDLLVGAYLADLPGNSGNRSGAAYLIYGKTEDTTATYKLKSPAGDTKLSPVGYVADGGDDQFPQSLVWLDFPSGTTSIETVVLTRTTQEVQNLNLVRILPFVWNVTTNRTGFSNSEIKFRYFDSDLAGVAESELSLYRSSSLSGPWTLLSTTQNQDKNTISATISNSQFGYFAMGVLADTVPPTFIVEGLPTRTNSNPLTGVSLIFSEPITGLSADDFGTVGADVTNLVGSGKIYTIDLDINSPDGVKSFQLPANKVEDASGLANNESLVYSFEFDSTPPTLSIPNLPTYTNLPDVTLQLEFDEPVTGLELSDFEAPGSTVYDLTGSLNSYTMKITYSVNGTKSVRLKANSVVDSLGNENELSDLFEFVWDNTRPQYSGITSLPQFTNLTTIPNQQISFTEPISGLNPENFTGNGISVSNIQGNGTTFTFELNLTSSNGTKSYTLDASEITDLSGNQATQTFTRSTNLDTTPPVAELIVGDLTQVGLISGSYSLSDGAGVGGATSRIWYKRNNENWTQYTGSYSSSGNFWLLNNLTQDGVYQFKMVGRDSLNNATPNPTGDDPGQLTIIYNNFSYSEFIYPSILPGEYLFPITGTIDYTVNFSAGATGGPFGLSTSLGNVGVGTDLPSNLLIDERINIIGSFTGDAFINWVYNPDNDDTPGAITSAYHVRNGILLQKFDAVVSGTTVTFGPVSSPQDGDFFYLGNDIQDVDSLFIFY
ncbi:MAG: integrin alpha [Candidatus Sumerlaeia bacterium]|nr:integrin alpha [Candidatus Sumerlaeia bacterium]